MNTLGTTLVAGTLRLEPFADYHVDGLRAACALDTEIWAIYPLSWEGAHFATSLAYVRSQPGWVRFAVIDTDRVVGMTNYIGVDRASGVLEIGGTYIAPHVRGTGLNRAMKVLLIDHAIANGFTRIEFRVDTRNTRSMAAVAKLGAVHEGTLRKNRVTWTGYVRDTAVFGLLADEWAAHQRGNS